MTGQLSLYDYQTDDIVEMSAHRRYLNGSEVGTGKTPIMVKLCDRHKAARIVLLTTRSVCIHIAREFERWQTTERRVTVISTLKQQFPADGVTILTYDMARRPEILEQLMVLPIDMLLLDEAHQLKERKSQRTVAVYGKGCRGQAGLVSNSDRVYVFSGTIAPNHSPEIWTHLRALAPELLAKKNGAPMTFPEFQKRYTKGFDNGYGWTPTGNRNVKDLRERLSTIYLRRRKIDVLKDLPKIRYADYPLNCKLPKHLTKTGRIEITENDGDLIVDTTPEWRREVALAKVDPVAELSGSEIEDGLQKLIIFSMHREPLRLLEEKLAAHNPVRIDGSVSPTKRQEIIDRFQNDPACKVFLGQIVAAGTGINLTAAHNVIFLDASYSPSENEQAAARCHRPPQTNSVLVRFTHIADTVDENVNRILCRKAQMLTELLD